jgi:hypothetical protein
VFPLIFTEDAILLVIVSAVPAETVAALLKVSVVETTFVIVVPAGMPLPVIVAPIALAEVIVALVEPSEFVKLLADTIVRVVLAEVAVFDTAATVTTTRST